MEINVRNKIRSLLRRNCELFCLSYNWQYREIQVYKSSEQYFQQIQNHLANGFVKRTQCYLDQTIQVQGGQQYLIYLISFGDFRRGKMVNGENPIAKGFGICVFDFVYFFIEPKPFALQKMKFRINQLQQSGDYFYSSLMKKNYCWIFEKNRLEIDEQNSMNCSEIKKNSEQSYTKYPVQINKSQQYSPRDGMHYPLNQIFLPANYSDESLISEEV